VEDFIIVFGYGGGKSRREGGRKKDIIEDVNFSAEAVLKNPSLWRSPPSG